MITRQDPVSETIEGQEHGGRFTVDKDGVLTVSYRGLSKTEDPLPLAKELLRQLVDEVRREQRM
jgi:hypothetical protein